jgi:hypothetical protein
MIALLTQEAQRPARAGHVASQGSWVNGATVEIDTAHLAPAVSIRIECFDGAIDLIEKAAQPQLGVFAGARGRGHAREIDLLAPEHRLEKLRHLPALAQQRGLPRLVGHHRGSLGVACSVRVELPQARREAADIALQLPRSWTGEDLANLQIDVDQGLRGSKLRLAVAKPDAGISQQPLEQDELPLQIRFLRLDGYQVIPDLASAMVTASIPPCRPIEDSLSVRDPAVTTPRQPPRFAASLEAL